MCMSSHSQVRSASPGSRQAMVKASCVASGADVMRRSSVGRDRSGLEEVPAVRGKRGFDVDGGTERALDLTAQRDEVRERSVAERGTAGLITWRELDDDPRRLVDDDRV